MPTPKDHRDITIVVQPPVSSTSTIFDLSYVASANATLLEQRVIDDANTDVTLRQWLVQDGGVLVLDVRSRLGVESPLQANQTATKLVDGFGQPSPLPGPGVPQAPSPNAASHFWTAAGLEAELTMSASTNLGGATVDVRASAAHGGRWDIVITRNADGKVMATGAIVLPADAIERGVLAPTG
jgi:hypothetical protein